jgi:hypothetical protein
MKKLISMIAILGMATAAFAQNGQFRSRCIRPQSHTARIPARLSRATTLCERKNWQSLSTRSTPWSLPSRLSRSTTKNILRVGGGRNNQLYIQGKPTGFCRGPRQGNPTAYSTFNCNDRNRLAAANAQQAAQRAPAPAAPVAPIRFPGASVIGGPQSMPAPFETKTVTIASPWSRLGPVTGTGNTSGDTSGTDAQIRNQIEGIARVSGQDGPTVMSNAASIAAGVPF